MNRRDAIIRMALLMGGTMVGPRLLAASLDTAGSGQHGFDAAEIALLDEIGDTIIPATSTPGAKAVQIGAFMAMMVHDCYTPVEQAGFKAGLARVAELHQTRHGQPFAAGSVATRTALLNELDEEQRRLRSSRKTGEPAHFFRMMKELTVIGYFTSEIGATQALRHVEAPGSYNGSLPYKKGDKAWAI